MTARLGRGLAALAALVGALVGIPVALTALGQGPPRGVPSWSLVTHGLTHGITDSTLLRAAALLCWLVWALFVVAVAIEVVSQSVALARRIPARRRFGVPGLQGCARTLVLSVALLIPARGMTGAMAAPGPTTATAAVTTIAPAPAVPPSAGSSALVTGAPTPVAMSASAPRVEAHRYVVQRYDSLWAIAARHLGSGTRWREIRGVAGQRLEGEEGRAPIIHPGEVVLLPPGSFSLPRPAATGHGHPITNGATSGTRPAGDPVTLSPPPATTAAATSQPASPPPRPVATAPVTTATAAATSQPASPPPRPVATAPVTTPTTAGVGAPSADSPPTMVALAANRAPTRGGTSTAALLEAGLVGAAVLSTVEVLRRRQAQRRTPGRRIRLPAPALATTELALRRSETPNRVSLVERAVGSLVASLRQQGTSPPTILGVLVDDDTVEVLLAAPAPPPTPWTASAEGFRWQIHRCALPAVAPEESAPLPALASLGRVATGTADALINLEAAGLVAINGDPGRAAGVLYALAAQLIGAPWARAVNLILVAVPAGLAAPDNVRNLTSLGPVAAELRQTAEVMSATTGHNGCADAFTGRLRGLAGDGWPPVVVLCARRPSAEEMDLLATLTQPGHGVVAVVVNAGAAARWAIDVDAQPCPVNPLRLAVQPTVLDAETVAAIAELVEVAEDTDGAGLDDPPYDRVEISVERPAAGAEPDRVADPAPPRNGSAALENGSAAPKNGSAAQKNGSALENGSSHNGSTLRRGATPATRSLTERVARLQGSNGSNGSELDHPVEPPDLGKPPILVRVLGSVEVDGASDFKRAKSRELVVYLAMHPNGVGEAELDEALWGSSGARVVVSSTRDATVSVARSALGGAARLLPAQGQGREKRYQLGAEVQSDWGQFCVLHRFGRQHRSAAALRQALELIRGRPFEAVISGRTYGWIHTEGHSRHIEAEVADAADLASGLFLAAGDPLAARWAARRGLVAEPYTERLWVRLMESADVLGESQEIERIMDEVDAVLELEGDFTGLHPNTLATYDRLSRRRRFPADR